MANFTMNYTQIMKDLVPVTNFDALLQGVTVKFTKPVTELYICDTDAEGKNYPKGWETIIDEHNITDAKAARIFLDNHCTFGRMVLTIRRPDNKFDEAIYYSGKTEKAVAFYQRILETLMVLTDIEKSTDLGTDTLVGKEIKLWSVRTYQVYLDKKENIWKLGEYTNIILKDPGYDVVEQSNRNKELGLQELALQTAPKSKKRDKKDKVSTI